MRRIDIMDEYYEFVTEDKIEKFGIVLFRIRALKNLKNGVKTGDLGGYVENKKNLYGDAWVYGNARVYGDAQVSGDAWVSDNARVYGNARVYDNARVYGDAQVSGDAWVSDNARVYGDALVYGNARVSNCLIKKTNDYITVSCLGSRLSTLTVCLDSNGFLNFSTGCFNGTENEFREKIKETHGKNKNAKLYFETIKFVKKFFEIRE